MENFKKFIAFLFSLLVTIIGFFLYMFYLKVDKIQDGVQEMNISNAVKEEKLKSIENRISNLEKAVNYYQTSNQR